MKNFDKLSKKDMIGYHSEFEWILPRSGWGGFFRWVRARCVRLVREWWLCGLPNLLPAGRPAGQYEKL